MPETIGLDIGSHSIKLVGLKVTSKGPFLTHLGIKEIPHGEEKEDTALLSEIIKALYKEGGLKPGEVSLTVSSSGIHIARIIIPSMPKRELKEALRWEMKNRLPYPIESAQIDFHILKEFIEKDSKNLDIITVACPTHLIHRMLSIAEGAGLKLMHLTVGPFAIWNILLALARFKKDEVIGLIDIGAEKTGIYLFRDGILQFSREVAPAGADITRAMMEGIDSQESPDLIYEQAERIKKTIGIPSKGFLKKNGDQSVDLSKIPFLVRPVLERMMAEISRSLDYCKNQFHVEHVDRLLLTGGGAHLKNLSLYLSEELRLSVERFNPLQEMLFDANKIDLQLLEQIGPVLAAAAGTALPERNAIELLPAKEPVFSRARMEKYIPRISILVALLVFGLIVWDTNGEISRLQKELEDKMAKVRATETLQANLQILKEKEAQIKQNLSAFPPSILLPVPFQEMLETVSYIVPENVTATLLSVHSNPKTQHGGSETGDGNELQIKGLAFGNDLQCLTALAQIIEGLEKSPLFKNVKLVSADENKSYNQPGLGFEIICDIELDRPPSPPFRKWGKLGEDKK